TTLHRRALATHRALELARGLLADYQSALRRFGETDRSPGLRALQPGAGFTAATAQPGHIGTGLGADAKAIARWNVVPRQDFAGRFEVGVVAFHMAGIDRVSFSVNGGDWVDVHEPTLNPRTDTIEYWATLDAADFGSDT